MIKDYNYEGTLVLGYSRKGVDSGMIYYFCPMLKYIAIVLWGLCKASCLSAQYSIAGNWSGVAQIGNEKKYLRMELKKNGKSKLTGTLYDSGLLDKSYSLSEVTGSVLNEEQDRFLIEGTNILAYRKSSANPTLLAIYIHFISKDTILAKIAKAGNYISLLGNKEKGSNEFKLGRFQLRQTAKEPKNTPPAKEIISIKKTPPPAASEDSFIMEDSFETLPPPPPIVKKSPKTDYSIFIQDSDREDGDIVNVYANKRLVLKNARAKKAPLERHILLPKRENIIEIESVDEGTISPTTVYIQLQQEGKVKTTLSLRMKKGEIKSHTVINSSIVE